MELGLSLGDGAPNSNNNKSIGFLSKPSIDNNNKLSSSSSSSSSSSLVALGFCVGLRHDHSRSGSGSVHDQDGREDDDDDDDDDKSILPDLRSGLDPPVQALDLLPLAPVPRSSSHLPFPWLSHRLMPELGCSKETEGRAVARAVTVTEAFSSPKSACLLMEFGSARSNGRKRSSTSENEVMENERGWSRISDDEENNGSATKKLRLSKHQSAFLEQSFKQHTTLNPKQKLTLAKQLNLRPRQVEVWFQNRRARTKLKQTEVDCEYLRRCCETLTEENRRLQKELQELRALKSSQPFYMHLPATTLTMCPSCERVSTTAPAASVATTTTTVPAPSPLPSLCLANKPTILPFPHLHQAAS